MHSQKSITKQSFLYIAKKRLLPKQKRVPAELQQAINDCKTIQELLDLLFSTDFIKDESIIDAFDKRIEDLDCPF